MVFTVGFSVESRVPLSAATVFPSVVTRIIPFVEIGPFSANVAGIVCGDSSKRTPAAAANQGNGINLLCLAGDLSIGQILTRQPKTKRRTPSVQSVTTFLRRLDVNAGIHGSRPCSSARARRSQRKIHGPVLPSNQTRRSVFCALPTWVVGWPLGCFCSARFSWQVRVLYWSILHIRSAGAILQGHFDEDMRGILVPTENCHQYREFHLLLSASFSPTVVKERDFLLSVIDMYRVVDLIFWVSSCSILLLHCTE